MIFSLDQFGDRLALYDTAEARWWTYTELAASVRSLAEILASQPKSLLFNFCRNDTRSICLYLAALEAGQPVALLDDSLRAELKDHLLAPYRPDLIASSTLPQESNLLSNSLWMAAGGLHQTPHQLLAVMLSTSGSTGSPKFVRLTRANIEANAASISSALDIHPDERAVTSLPIHYSYGLSVLNTHLQRGASVVLTDEGLMAPTFWRAVRELDCTSFAGVPYSYQILNRLTLEGLNLPKLRTLTQAGGKLNNDLVAKFSEQMRARGGRFFVMYGQTEATARIAILPSEALPLKLGSAGKAIPGGNIRIEGESGSEVPLGTPGELIYEGPNVMMGYATSRQDLALGDVLGGRLRTGDMASIDADGYIFMTGRAKRDAKLYGLRINLDEVEDLLRKHGPTAVVSRDDKLRIFCEYGDEAQFEQYRRDMAAQLQIHYQAFEFVRVDQLPTKGSGKIDYQSLLNR